MSLDTNDTSVIMVQRLNEVHSFLRKAKQLKTLDQKGMRDGGEGRLEIKEDQGAMLMF